MAQLPSKPVAEEADDGMIYRYGGFADKGSGQLRVSSRILREAQLDEQPGASLLVLGVYMYLCTCCTTSSKKVLRDTPLTCLFSRETQASNTLFRPPVLLLSLFPAALLSRPLARHPAC